MQTTKLYKYTVIYAILILSLYFTGLMSACSGSTTGSGNAETQASLPAPTEDSGITISSPDSLGYVVIAGNNAVPDGAIVIVDVNSTTAFLDTKINTNLVAKKFMNWIIPNAYADTCTSALPECPTLDNGQCQFTSDAEGSFTLQVPADIGAQISVSYLDPTGCAEVAVFEDSEVTDDTPALALIGTDAAIDADNRRLYITAFLNDGSDAAAVQVYDLDTHAPVTSNSMFDLECPYAIDVLNGSGTSRYMTLKGYSTDGTGCHADTVTDFGTLIQFTSDSTNNDNMVDQPNFYQLIELSGAPIYANTLNLDQFIDPTATIACTSIIDPTQNYSRIYFTDGHALYFNEFQNDIINTDPAKIDRTNFTITPTSLIMSFTNANDPAYSGHLSDIKYFSKSNSDDASYHMVVGVTDTLNATTYYYFKLSASNNLCGGAVSLDIANDNGVRIGTLDSFLNFDPQFSFMSAYDVNGDLQTFLAVSRPNTSEMLFIDTNTLGNYKESTIDFSSGVISSQVFIDGRPDSDLPDRDLAVTDRVTRFLTIQAPDADVSEVFFLSYRYGGSGFVTTSEASTFDPGVPLNTMYPVNLLYDYVGNQFVALDLGITTSDDSEAECTATTEGSIASFSCGSHPTDGVYSFLRFYPLQ